MANLSTTLPHSFAARRRTRTKILTTSQTIEMEWDQTVDAYTNARATRVKQHFIDKPLLLASFYEFLALAPKELRDIEDFVRLGDIKRAFIEFDDCIEKFMAWRLKLKDIISNPDL